METYNSLISNLFFFVFGFFPPQRIALEPKTDDSFASEIPKEPEPEPMGLKKFQRTAPVFHEREKKKRQKEKKKKEKEKKQNFLT